MEKYSKWRDPGTGIQPFLPIVPQRKNQSTIELVSYYLKRWLIGPILIIVKVPLLVVLGLVGYILYALGSVNGLNGLFKGFLFSIIIRVKLFILGFYNINFNVTTLKRGIKSKAAIKPKLPSTGNVIVANSSSYLDLFYLQMKYNPVFIKIDPNSGKVAPSGLYELFFNFGGINNLNPKVEFKYSLGQFIDHSKKLNSGPIVVFLEGTSTNGRGLLSPISNVLNGVDENTNIHIICLKYPNTNFSPTFPAGNLALHIITLCSQLVNHMSVLTLSCDEVNSFVKEDTNSDITQSIITLLSNVSKLRKLSLNCEDKQQFLDYYYNNIKKD